MTQGRGSGAVMLALGLIAAGPGQAAGLAPINCLIEPEEVIRLATPVAGIIAEVLVDRGDVVRRGDVVARLDTAVEEIARDLARARAGDRSRLQSLEARVEFLAAQSARMAELAGRNAISATAATEAQLEARVAEGELDEARINHALAQHELQQAEVLLAQKTLTAPVEGVIVERLLGPGEYRDTQSHIVTIARLDRLRVEAFAPLSYFGTVALGDVVSIRPEAPIGGAYPATITVIDRIFDAATATFGLRMALENPGLALPAGLRCEVRFDP